MWVACAPVSGVVQALRSFATVPDREPMLDKFLLRTNMPQVSLNTPFPGVKVPTEYVGPSCFFFTTVLMCFRKYV